MCFRIFFSFKKKGGKILAGFVTLESQTVFAISQAKV